MPKIPTEFCNPKVCFASNSEGGRSILIFLATGEPPLNLSIVVLFAVTDALNSARRDAGGPDGYHQLSEFKKYIRLQIVTELIFYRATCNCRAHFLVRTGKPQGFQAVSYIYFITYQSSYCNCYTCEGVFFLSFISNKYT